MQKHQPLRLNDLSLHTREPDSHLNMVRKIRVSINSDGYDKDEGQRGDFFFFTFKEIVLNANL